MNLNLCNICFQFFFFDVTRRLHWMTLHYTFASWSRWKVSGRTRPSKEEQSSTIAIWGREESEIFSYRIVLCIKYYAIKSHCLRTCHYLSVSTFLSNTTCRYINHAHLNYLTGSLFVPRNKRFFLLIRDRQKSLFECLDYRIKPITGIKQVEFRALFKTCAGWIVHTRNVYIYK